MSQISLMAKRPCPGWSHGVRGRGSNAVLEVPALEQCSLVQPRGAAARGGLGQWPLAKSDMPEGTPERGGKGWDSFWFHLKHQPKRGPLSMKCPKQGAGVLKWRPLL